MSNDGRIDYVEFPASNIGSVKAFYTDVFNWRFEDYGADYTTFFDGRLNGGFHRANAPEENVSAGPLVVLYADDLETSRQRVIDAGGRISTDIFEFPGGRRFHFVDPVGNELAVWTQS